MATFTPQHPYIQVNVGGNTTLAQSSHGSLLVYDDTTGDLVSTSMIYGRLQQQNAFGPLFNLAVGFALTQYIRTALSLSYFQSAQTAKTIVTLDDLSPGGTTTSYFTAQTWLALINLYADLNHFFPMLSSTTKPYVGAGVGIANNNMGTQSTYYEGVGLGGKLASNSSRNFAYKLMAGINYNLLQNVLFNIEYAFVSAGQLQSGRTGKTAGFTFVSPKTYEFPLYSNQISAGLVFVLA